MKQSHSNQQGSEDKTVTGGLPSGLYEQIINSLMDKEINSIPETERKQRINKAPLDKEEAAQYLTQYLSEMIYKALISLKDDKDENSQVRFTNDIVRLIAQQTEGEDWGNNQVLPDNTELLLTLLKERDPRLVSGNGAKSIIRPESSISRSSLFTGAVHEPQMLGELKKEIQSTDSIDMLVSFIKWSGLRSIIDELKQFTNNGGQLRIVTTSYLGATDLKAIEELNKLPNTSIRISYDTERTRLHAKAYIFHRATGFSTAYVGSSNLSRIAISSGLEWNIKVTQKELPDTIEKINATFDSYWNSTEFEDYREDQQDRLELALMSEKQGKKTDRDYYVMDIRPYPYQQEILDQLQAERDIRGRYKNLVVAATGTGKTVVAALDYRRFIQSHPKETHKLLFVAHREEILEQSIMTFRAVLKDANFGSLWVGNHKPLQTDYLFISIQTLNSQGLTEKLEADHYDYIVIDEFHHAAAASYQDLLTYFQPKILLGLTATPERLDKQNILDYFDGHTAAEIRLPEAINRKLLCPFQYFGVTDPVNLTDCSWRAGKYDILDLERHYANADSKESVSRAESILRALENYSADMNKVIALGFCVSIKHAEFMSRFFCDHGVPSLCLTSSANKEERNAARKKLVTGEVRIIFTVDLYNEGVDIPEINTVLFLRPTDSLTIFIQQLGRGLRLSDNKDCLTVLDFIGQANKNYSFEKKFSAILAESHKSLKQEIQQGFLSVPTGCFIQLEPIAMQHVLTNISKATGSQKYFVECIQRFVEERGVEELSLGNFLRYYDFSPALLYKQAPFSRLCVEAEIKPQFNEPLGKEIASALLQLTYVNSRRWIKFLLSWLEHPESWNPTYLSPEEQRMLQMFYVTIWKEGARTERIPNWNNETVKDRLAQLAKCTTLLKEIRDLLSYNLDQINFVDEKINLGFPCPLDLHCAYSRDQLLVALDFMTPQDVREGVKWVPEHKVDILLVTLNKSEKDYSPTTYYNDYSINDSLFHWQSQSTTSEHSATGQRYINHAREGSKVLLFVREFKNDRITGKACPYTCLGLATYVEHTGSRPMSITWKLDRPIPARFLKITEKLVLA